MYGSVEAADAYHAARGRYDWADMSEPDRMAALVRASDWIDARFRSRFPGAKAGGRAQVREWPRINATDTTGSAILTDEIPIEIEHATYEAAYVERSAGALLEPERAIQSYSVRVGPISEATVYSDAVIASAGEQVSKMLAGLLCRGRSSSRMLWRA